MLEIFLSSLAASIDWILKASGFIESTDLFSKPTLCMRLSEDPADIQSMFTLLHIHGVKWGEKKGLLPCCSHPDFGEHGKRRLLSHINTMTEAVATEELKKGFHLILDEVNSVYHIQCLTVGVRVTESVCALR